MSYIILIVNLELSLSNKTIILVFTVSVIKNELTSCTINYKQQNTCIMHDSQLCVCAGRRIYFIFKYVINYNHTIQHISTWYFCNSLGMKFYYAFTKHMRRASGPVGRQLEIKKKSQKILENLCP